MNELSLNEDECWQAVLERDIHWDGRFVYGVRSTGIYCRASCPSRRPGRAGVRFFSDPGEAARAGFRACKRCLPDDENAQVERVRLAAALVEAQENSSLSLAELGRAVGVSPYHLQRTFKRLMGVTPHQYAGELRAERLKTRLQNGESVLTAMYDAGYGSSRQLYEAAPSALGMTPGAYRRGGRGERIRFSVVPCPLDFLMVAATERGLCSVALGDDAAVLEAALQAEFPAAELVRDDDGLCAWSQRLVRELEGQANGESDALPLDTKGTTFQRRVWEELRAIERGQTRSYAEVAHAIGQPQAVRAVARACATNPVALIVPCHRVVRGNGQLSGYRWGIERKRELLRRERENRVN